MDRSFKNIFDDITVMLLKEFALRENESNKKLSLRKQTIVRLLTDL